MNTSSQQKIRLRHIIGLVLLTAFLFVSVTLWVLQYFSPPKPATPVSIEAQQTTATPPPPHPQ
jgi:CHASE1-domain containing sensor protein